VLVLTGVGNGMFKPKGVSYMRTLADFIKNDAPKFNAMMMNGLAAHRMGH
jgi:hypothetical protein